jgi:hypothetical protein
MCVVLRTPVGRQVTSRAEARTDPHTAGNLLEVIWLELDDDAEPVIHAIRLRAAFYDLLPTRHREDTP